MTTTTAATRPLECVLFSLTYNPPPLNARQQNLGVSQRQTRSGNIAGTARSFDPHHIQAPLASVCANLYQPHNPSHAPAFQPKNQRKIPIYSQYPQSCGSPGAASEQDRAV
jgi:hypothetical protein